MLTDVTETDGINVNLMHALFHRSNFLLLVCVAITTQRGQSRNFRNATILQKRGKFDRNNWLCTIFNVQHIFIVTE